MRRMSLPFTGQSRPLPPSSYPHEFYERARLGRYTGKEWAPYRVRTLRVDTIWREHLHGARLDFVKIDVDTSWKDIGLEGMFTNRAFSMLVIELDASWGGRLYWGVGHADQLAWLAARHGYDTYLKPREKTVWGFHLLQTGPPYGDTLLHMAAFVGHEEMVSALLGAGARASRVGSSSGCSALHAAAAADQPKICRLLLEAGAQLHTASASKKHTALHVACVKGHEAVARVLVEAGADPYDRSEAAESPVELLRAHETEQSKALLVALEELSLEVAGAAEAEAAEAEAAAAEAEAMPLMPQRSASMATDASEDEPEEDERQPAREGGGRCTPAEEEAARQGRGA
eukprot:jgi/Chrpa1/15081/Chrysochromulina_OHIO_Genome00019851-RA